MKVTFIGAIEGVTGSKSLLEINEELILIDAGLYQEEENIKKLNLEELPFKPKELSAIIITHAHLDHTGFLPFIYKEGFRGPIYLTEPTAKLTNIILNDSAELMQKQDLPLYSKEDAHNVVSLFRPHAFEEVVKINNCTIVFHKASHILGASFVELNDGVSTIVFSGDLGRYDDPLLGPPELISRADYLVVESTYGNRIRVNKNMESELEQILIKIHSNKQILIIPCFALHRAQFLAYLIKKIFTKNPRIKMPFYLNSPMMEEVTYAYKKFINFFIPTEIDLSDVWGKIYFLKHNWDIDNINKAAGPQIILASSGMLTGGRIWTHLSALSRNRDAVIFLPGFQAPGTPGYQLIHGAKKISSPEGDEIEIRAEVLTSEAFSSHADQDDLVNWIKTCKTPIKKIFIIHGEEKSKIGLKERLTTEKYLGIIPKKGESFEL